MNKASWLSCLLLAASLNACSTEQVQLGQWYRIDTPAHGACQPLEWHFVVDAQRGIAGDLSHPGIPPFGRIRGALALDDSFRMIVTGSDGQADVTGHIGPMITTIAITGTGAGADCNGHAFALRLGRYYQFQSGGGGGGR